jgi:hypothetical protein
MKSLIPTRAALGLTIAVMLSACQEVARPSNLACDFTPYLNAQTAGPAVVGPLPGTMSPVPLNTVRVIDPRIGNKVLVQSVMARRTETGTVEVVSRLINCTDFPLHVQGRTMFLDQNNFDVEPASAWQRVYLSPRALGQYGEKSTDIARAVNFSVEIREGD